MNPARNTIRLRSFSFAILVILTIAVNAAPVAGSVTMAWDPNSESYLAGYNVYRSNQLGVFTSPPLNGATLVTTTSFTDSTVQSSQTYYYVIRAVSTGGQESSNSNVIQVVVNPAPDVVPPSVSITAPASGTTVSGAAVTVSATATDNVGVVGVQFKMDGTNLGAEVTTSPYSVSWSTTTVSNGTHSLTAVARDAAGNQTTASAIVVTVNNADTTPPTVSLTAPAPAATVSGTSVTISAAAADNVGVVGVQFKLDGVNLNAEDSTSPYSIAWNTTTATNGTHSLTAVARDAAGNQTTASAIVVTVNNADTTPPTVSLTAPAPGATVSGTSVTISVAAADNVGVVGVQFKLDGVNLNAEDSTSPYSIAWNTTTATNGTHSLTAVARDAAGNQTTASAIVVTVNNADTTPPTVSLTAPAPGATVSGTSVTISVAAADNVGVVGVQFKLDGVNLNAEDSTSPYSIAWNTTTATNGTHSLTAVARDAAGNQTTASAIVVTVNNADTTPPTVSLTAPAPGATVSGTSVTISVAAADNVGVVGVQFKLDGVNLNAEDSTSPYSIAWNTTTATNGTHSVTAVARDAAGNQTTASAIIVTVNNANTTPAITSAASASGTAGSAFSYQITATNSPTAYGASGLPAGLSINTATGLISGSPAAAGTSTVTLSAIGSTGTGNATLALTITSANISPVPPSGSILPFSVPNLGTTSMTLGGKSGTVGIGHAAIQVSPGMPAPAGVAIFGLRETGVSGFGDTGVVVTEAGVPATPLMQTGRLYMEVTGSLDTGLAITNPGAQDAVVSFFFTDTTGATFGSGTTTIPAGQQIAKFLNEAPFNLGKAGQGAFTFSSSAPVAVIALRTLVNDRGDFLITTLPVVDLSAAAGSSVVLLPQFADGGGWVTSVVLVNPTDNAISGLIQFVDPSGAVKTMTAGDRTTTTFSYSIAGRSSFKLVTAGPGTTTTSGSVRIMPAANTVTPAALAVYSYKSAGITVTEAGVPWISGTAFRTYVEASGTSGAVIQSGVAIANPDTNPAAVKLELFNHDGTLAATTTLIIPASGQIARFLTQLFPYLPQPFQGVLRISTSSPALAVVGLRTRVNERGDFLITTTPPSSETPLNVQVFFPQLAIGGGYTTQLILFSGWPGQSSSGTLNFVSPSGVPLPITLQ